MNTNRKAFRLILLAVVLTFVMVGLASAGAIFRRGSDEKDDSKNTTVTKSSNTKTESRASSAPRVQTDRARQSDRGKPAEQVRPTERARTSDQIRPADQGRSGQFPTLKDRKVDAVSTQRNKTQSIYDPRPGDKSIYDPRPQDRSIYDPRPADRPTVEKRTPSRDSRPGDRSISDRKAPARDNNKYARQSERPGHEVSSFQPAPRRVGQYYHYNTGWAHKRDFPCRYGGWLFSYTPKHSVRSAFFYYGYFPYVPSTRVIIVSRPRVVYVDVPIVVDIDRYGDDGYYLERPSGDSIDRALGDIRASWLRGDPSLLLKHVRYDINIDVLLDGDYSYTVTGSDYQGMVGDAISATRTSDFVFDSVRRRGSDRIVAYGRHTAYANDGDRKVVYVSYLLERRAGEWIIVEVGSSASRVGY